MNESEIIRCENCRKDFEVTHELASYKCPHCKTIRLIKKIKKLDEALKKLEDEKKD